MSVGSTINDWPFRAGLKYLRCFASSRSIPHLSSDIFWEFVIESVRPDGACFCYSTNNEILQWIVEHVPEFQFGTTLQIKRDPFGWIVALGEENG